MKKRPAHEVARSNPARAAAAGQASRLVSCFWCTQPHLGRHPLSICPSCQRRLGSQADGEASAGAAD